MTQRPLIPLGNYACEIITLILTIGCLGGCNCKQGNSSRRANEANAEVEVATRPSSDSEDNKQSPSQLKPDLFEDEPDSPHPVPKGMVYISGGEFSMGCDPAKEEDCRGDEMPHRMITVAPFFINKFEVSVAQYNECIASGKCEAPDSYLAGDDYRGFCNYGREGHELHPVNCLSWSQAQNYCAWGNKRLLTEAEWERAARGPSGRIFPWGNAPTPSCEYATMYDNGLRKEGCGRQGTSTVDSNRKGATRRGVSNLLGNVAEWIADLYTPDSYSKLPNKNPKQDKKGKNRVTRGGSFASEASLLRNSKRHWIGPDSGYRGVGVRCGQSANSP